MRCATHPGVETGLRCSKCDKPICPRCMVSTPVGARCPQCARVNKLPTFQVPAKYMFRAIGSGLGIAIVSGVIWGVVSSVLPGLLFNLLLAAGVGYAIGEGISIAANRKRGTRLAIIATFAVLLSYLVSVLPPWGSLFSLFSLMSFIFGLVSIAVAIFVATGRLR